MLITAANARDCFASGAFLARNGHFHDAATLMKHLLAPCEDGPPAPLVESACAFAAGNPLLLEQMVRIYHDKGVLSEVTVLSDEPRWTVELDKLEQAKLPITIDDAVNARIAALDAFEVTLLEQAAAMGAVFWSGAFVPLARMGREAPPHWDRMSEGDVEEILGALEDLVDRDYILKLPDSTFPGSDEYVFKHNREREAIAKRTKKSAEKRPVVHKDPTLASVLEDDEDDDQACLICSL